MLARAADTAQRRMLGQSQPLLRIQLHGLALGTFASLVAPFGGFFASGIKRAYKIKVPPRLYLLQPLPSTSPPLGLFGGFLLSSCLRSRDAWGCTRCLPPATAAGLLGNGGVFDPPLRDSFPLQHGA
jgi:hypothetical protein